jgi:tetratricopeptide (TPR) repeat protein
MVDIIEGVKIVVGQDVAQDIDMSRKAYIDSLSSDMKKKVEEKKKEYAAVSKTNSVVKNLNADLKTCDQDLNDANAAHQAAVQALGATASSADIEAKEAEIRTAKFTEIETLMLKDTAAKPDASVLWAQLAQAQLGLKKYDEAEAAYKKALAADAASKKPDPSIQGAANAGLGEAYARTGKVPEANAAFDAAAKANPAGAANYFKNEAGIFSNLGNADAQVAAAQEAVKADPTLAFAYYLIGNGLVGKSVPDPKTNMLVPPPGCLEAYQMYLKLAPTGPYAADVKSILSSLQTALPPAATPAKSGKRK